MSTSTTGPALAEQYDRMWEMMRAAIHRFTPEEWRAGDRPGLVPARWALHAIEAADFYSRPAPDGSVWAGRFGVDWEAPAEEQPGQDAMLDYLGEVQVQVGAWLRGASDADLLGENAFPWTGPNVLSRAVYALRHTMYHLGEMSMLLRLRGAEETEWR